MTEPAPRSVCCGTLLVSFLLPLLLIGFASLWLIISGADFFVSGRIAFLRSYFPCVSGLLFLTAGLLLPHNEPSLEWQRICTRYVSAALCLAAFSPFVAWSLHCRESLYLWLCGTMSLPALIWVIVESCLLIRVVALAAGLPRLRRTAEHGLTAIIYLVIAPLAAVISAHLINNLSHGCFQPSGLFDALQYPQVGFILRMLLLWGLIHLAVLVFFTVVSVRKTLSVLLQRSCRAEIER